MEIFIKFIQDYINVIILLFFISNLFLFGYLIYFCKFVNSKLKLLIKNLAQKCNYKDTTASNESILRKFEEDLNSKSILQAIEDYGYFDAKSEGIEELHLGNLAFLKNLFATIIESFTMLGILGTVCAMAVALTESKIKGSQQPIERMIESFNQGVTSTVYGLMAAIFFMIVYSYVNTKIEEMMDTRKNYLTLFEKAIRLVKENKNSKMIN